MLIALACDSGGDPDSPSENDSPTTPPNTNACTPARAHAPGETRETLISGDTERSYLLRVPPAYDGAVPAPLLLALHGFGSSAEQQRDMSALGESADARSVITVFPEGSGNTHGWNVAEFETGPDDSAFLQAIVDRLDDTLCIDETRIYATGYSNGGGMALRFACEAGGTIAAVAPVAATFPACQSDVPMIAFHGSADLVVPYEGGVMEGGTLALPPVHRAASEWARARGCDALPTIARPAGDVELSTYGNCPPGEPDTLLYTVIGGGHTWPGAALELDPALAGVTTRSISANELMLDFFAAREPQ
jgi:polyhydroxybutyrate depolymerase